MNPRILTPLLIVSLVAGCSSLKEGDEQTILNASQQTAFLEDAQQPQEFGYNVFPTQGGIAMQGIGRLHPNHMASVSFLGESGAPVIQVTGKSSRIKMNALIDTASPSSWIEFGKAMKFKAVPLGFKGQVFPYKGIYDVGAVNAVVGRVSQMRIDDLFIENIPLYIRLAVNSLGPLNRGIEDPRVDGVIGYDLLKEFEYIRFDLMKGTVALSSSTTFSVNENLLMATARIVNQPNCGLTVQGAIFGEPTPIVLDVAGNYYLERSDTEEDTTSQVSLGDVVYLDMPTKQTTVRNIPPRAGRRMLEKYIITVCPRQGVVYFERPVR